MAQTDPQIGFVKPALAAIRTWLRENVPGFKSMALSDDEIIRNHLMPARDFVRRGAQADRAASSVTAPALSRDAGEQLDTAAFKAWYGNWQNAVDEPDRPDTRVPAKSSGNHGRVDAGGGHDVDALQRRSRMVTNNSGPTTVGQVLFTGASGPVGEDGKPVVFFHGTREDISVFRIGHVGRLDKGWIGSGIYTTSSADLAELYAEQKRGSGNQNVMPLYVAVRNPFVATDALKMRLKIASQETICKFTQALKDLDHDGAVMPIGEGYVELVAFASTQIKSATGNKGNFDGSNPDIRFSRSQAASLTSSVTDKLNETFKHPGTLSWWHKTVGSM